MMMRELPLGVSGVTLTMTVMDMLPDGTSRAANLSTATQRDFLFESPVSHTVFVRQAGFVTDGTDGKLSYVCTAGDFVEDGVYQWQGDIVTPTWAGRTSIERFSVARGLARPASA